VDRRDLQALSRIRMNEAKGLLGLGLYDGAYYLAGYAVECALKACIAKETKRHEFPDRRKVDASHTHELRELVRLAKLEAAHRDRLKADPEFRRNWGTVESWTEQSRYQRYHSEEARRLVEAVCNRRHGIIAWVKLYW